MAEYLETLAFCKLVAQLNSRQYIQQHKSSTLLLYLPIWPRLLLQSTVKMCSEPLTQAVKQSDTAALPFSRPVIYPNSSTFEGLKFYFL